MTPMIDVVFQLLMFFMLTMNFKEIEGVLKTQVPRRGMMSAYAHPSLEGEIRVVLCAGGDTKSHLLDKGRHEAANKTNEVCSLMVEQVRIGDVYLTAKHPDRTAANRTLYIEAGRKIKELRELADPARTSVRVIVDADSETPYEHIIGIVNACKEVDIHNLEFVGNPRFAFAK